MGSLSLIILLILVTSVLLLCTVVVEQGKQITKLSDLLDKMDIALAKQHTVIDDQQRLIDDAVAGKFGKAPFSETT